MKNKILLLIIIMLLGVNTAICQTMPQSRAQAEAMIKSMSQEEIDNKLKELGISREEAMAQAKALNINVDDYLLKMQTSNINDYSQPINLPQNDNKILKDDFTKVTDDVKNDNIKIHGFTGRIDDNIKPFGYNIFNLPQKTFEPVINVAASPTYLLGAGDVVVISVWGDTKLNYQLQINREGNLIIPDVGPVNAMGNTIQQLQEKLLRRMTSVYSSLKNGDPKATSFLDISLGKVRTIQVFVLGEVNKPGGYSLSSLSTALHALYLSGGPTVDGSLRNIQIIRNNKTIETLDFYNYALQADKSKDIRLQDGDIVFVNPVGKRAAIVGLVKRPAVYELSESENLSTLIKFAGGLQFDAYIDRVHIERLVPFEERKNVKHNYLDFDIRFDSKQDLESSKTPIHSGDVVSIFKVDTLPENRVYISGNVKKPGTFELTQGMKIKDLLFSADSLDRNTFSERGTLFRLKQNLRKEVISFNPRLALIGDEVNNIELMNEDSVVIYQEKLFFPEHTVSIGGSVKKPGTYNRYDNMTVADLVVLAGGLTEDASLLSWELARMDTTNIGALSKIIKFNATEEYWNDNNNNIGYLQDFDHLMVPSNPKFNKQRVVVITGYVLYPGAYALKNEGEKLSSIIKRAGGLKPDAYLEGSTVIRKWRKAGLIPVDFEDALDDEDSKHNITLLDGDSINIAFKQEIILVKGEVFVPAAIVYKKGASLDYYIEQAGGTTEEADEDRILVMLPNGMRWEPGFFLFGDPDILGGSTIYVPKKIEKESNTLPILRDWATIMASLATMMIAIVQITK